MEIYTIEGSGRTLSCERGISGDGRRAKFERLLILPIPTSRDKKYITGTTVPCEDIIPLVTHDTLVAGYNIPPSMKAALYDVGAGIYDAAEDEDFLRENAEITAHGAASHILGDYGLDIADMKIGIIGCGRIGERLLRILLFFGASIRLFTGREDVRREMCEMGVECQLYPEADYTGLDLIVNTAPAKVMDERTLEAILPVTGIMDLASGQIFPKAQTVTKLASIPDKMYPTTAGRVYAKYIGKRLFEE